MTACQGAIFHSNDNFQIHNNTLQKETIVDVYFS